MVRGFVDLESPAANNIANGMSVRWQFGSAVRQDSVTAMGPAWQPLAASSDLPTTQYEWAISALNQVGQDLRAHVAYVTDGATMRGILPMLVSMRMGIEHFQFMTPSIGMPIDIPCTDPMALEQLLRSAIRLGRPIVLKRLLEQSAAAEMLKGMVGERRATIRIERAEPVMYLPITGFALQDKFQSAARVSILATSYGLSGGPNDVLFQFVSPSLEQVMQLFHESMQLQVADSAANGRRKIRRDLDTFEFLRAHAYNSAQRGEVRFSCLRLAGRLLAVQMFQVRKQTAWLLTEGNLERFRSTTVSMLLMGETIRKLQAEGIQRMVVPSAASVREIGQCQEMPCINVRIYPWSYRSLMAMLLGRGGNMARRLLRRRRHGQTPALGGRA